MIKERKEKSALKKNHTCYPKKKNGVSVKWSRYPDFPKTSNSQDA